MRSRFCKECEDWHDTEAPWPHVSHEVSRRSHLSTPFFVSDNLGTHVLNHADRKHYDSRSAYYKAVKAAGCEIVGNEKPKPFKPHKVTGSGADIKRAIEQLKAR